MFWAHGSGPCKQSMPELMELAAKPDRDFEILTVIAPVQFKVKKNWLSNSHTGSRNNDIRISQCLMIPKQPPSKFINFEAFLQNSFVIDSHGKDWKDSICVISNADAEAAFKSKWI